MTKSMGLFCFSVFFIAYLINGQVCTLAVLIVVYFKEAALPFQVDRFHLAVPLKRELQLADQNLRRAAYGPKRIFFIVKVPQGHMSAAEFFVVELIV